MIIKNRETLARSDARADALTILESGYEALNTKNVVREHVSRNGDVLTIGGEPYPRDSFRNIYIIGIGKCAFDAAEALEETLDDWITDGVIIDVQGGVLKRLRSFVGTHPLPSDVNVTAAGAVMALARNATEEDLVLCIISGGGSALLCWPHQMKCEEVIRITEELMHAGATIQEMNIVRKHISDVQGGQLAMLAYPARIVSLIFSDVPGDDISVVASGPTVLDTSTEEEAAAILAKYHILEACSLPKCDLVETPKDEKYFAHVRNILAVSNRRALDAMERTSIELGYTVHRAGERIQVEAKDLPRVLLEQLTPGSVVLGAGETTVTMTDGGGEGGRNQEAVLASLSLLRDGQVFISAASDGEDHGEDAGAIGDTLTLGQARALGLDAAQALQSHATHPFFVAVGDILHTGKTGTNVSDLFIALEKKS